MAFVATTPLSVYANAPKSNAGTGVAVHDIGMLVELVWIAVEFVAGQTLGSWSKGQTPAAAAELQWSESAGYAACTNA